MSRCIVTALPEAVVQDVLIHWLDIHHIVGLDSAFCVAGERTAYLRTAYNVTYVIRLVKHYDRGVSWFLLRGMQLNGVCLCGEFVWNDKLREAYLEKFGEKFRWVNVDKSVCRHKLVALDVKKWCPNLQSVVWSVSPYESPSARHDEVLALLLHASPVLQKMYLKRLALTQRGFGQILQQCATLTELTLHFLRVPLPVQVALPSLARLEMYYCTVPDALMIAIGENCPNLRRLYAFLNDDDAPVTITDAGVRAVAQGCLLLRETDVEHARGISQQLCIELVKLANFTELAFSGWNGMNDDFARGLLQVYPALLKLYCHCYGWSVSDHTLAICAQQCPLLECLSLVRCNAVTMQGVLPLFWQGNRLRNVTISDCQQLGDEVALAVAQNCLQLYMCCFEGTRLLNDTVVIKLAENCPLLVLVSLNSPVVSDTALPALATHCPQLRTLFLAGCSNLTMLGVRLLADSCKTLESVCLPRHFVLQEVRHLFDRSTEVSVSRK
jgi:hypothetical protein